MMVRGSVDVVTGTEVRGWAYAPGRSGPVLVQALLNHEILGEALADLHRPDLAAAGFGDGRSGYAIQLFRPIDPSYLPFIVVKVDGGDAELPRAPMLGFREFFSALHAAHPVAGRYRSVFGGLWTDRTDARALLRGKKELGQITAEVAVAVAQLIDEGFSLPTSEVGHHLRYKASEASALAGSMMDDSVLLPLLRAVFEDNPVALSVDEVDESATVLAQPSAWNESGSPAECLLLVVPLAGDVRLDIVRDSHRLPEFTGNGLSRWSNRFGGQAMHVADGQGMLDTYVLVSGTVALVGPGTLYRIRCMDAASALRVSCSPKRAVPMTFANVPGPREDARPSGVSVWA